MFWHVAVAAAGFLIGLRFRAGALLAATLATVILSLVLQTSGHRFGWLPLWLILQSVIVLQIGYLAGLAAAALWRHFRKK